MSYGVVAAAHRAGWAGLLPVWVPLLALSVGSLLGLGGVHAVVRSTDLVARLGGDGFAVQLDGVDEAGAARTTKRW